MKSRKARRLIMISLLGSTLAGCTVGPNHQQPATTMPAQWSTTQPATQSAVDVSLGEWWRIFRDPVLDDLIAQSVQGSLDLRAATARLVEARALRRVTAADELPSLDASGQYQRRRASANAQGSDARRFSNVGDDTNYWQGGFDANWEVDVFGRVRRSVEAAEADIAVAEEARRNVLVSLMAEVAREYVELRGFQQRVVIAQRNVRTQRQSLELTQARAQAGLVTQLDVAQQQAQLATTQAQIPALVAAAAQSRHRLSVLMGRQPQEILPALEQTATVPAAASIVPVVLPSELLLRRPDIRQAERSLSAATARIGVATADLYPRFSLTGAFGLESLSAADFFSKDSFFYSVGPTVRWPIFNAGRIRGNVQVQTARQEQALVQYESTVLSALADVENSLVAYVNEQVRRRSLVEAVEASRTAVALADELYARGLSDFLAVLEAQRSLFANEDLLVQSDRAVAVSLVSLYKALGGGWEPPEPSAPSSVASASTQPAK